MLLLRPQGSWEVDKDEQQEDDTVKQKTADLPLRRGLFSPGAFYTDWSRELTLEVFQFPV